MDAATIKQAVAWREPIIPFVFDMGNDDHERNRIGAIFKGLTMDTMRLEHFQGEASEIFQHSVLPQGIGLLGALIALHVAEGNLDTTEMYRAAFHLAMSAGDEPLTLWSKNRIAVADAERAILLWWLAEMAQRAQDDGEAYTYELARKVIANAEPVQL